MEINDEAVQTVISDALADVADGFAIGASRQPHLSSLLGLAAVLGKIGARLRTLQTLTAPPKKGE